MLRENKKISIIVNCFNGQEFLKEALDSVIKQTYDHWELIFFDNNSSDDSCRIVESYNNKNLKYLNLINI